MLSQVTAVRYVVPLREGGSLPAIVDVEPEGQFVVKFRGAGQGPKALVAEALAATLARVLGLPVPDAVMVSLDAAFGRGEPDPEIQDLLRASEGANFGLRYLPGALGYDLVADRGALAKETAADIVWFDALITNVDRTPRNPNLLTWQGKVWLIDHGASLYFHHAGGDWTAKAQSAFPQVRDHILLRRCGPLPDADARMRPLLTDAALAEAVANLPEEWLAGDAAEQRAAYHAYLRARLDGERAWVDEAERARRG